MNFLCKSLKTQKDTQILKNIEDIRRTLCNLFCFEGHVLLSILNCWAFLNCVQHDCAVSLHFQIGRIDHFLKLNMEQSS